MEAFALAEKDGIALGDVVAARAWETAAVVLAGTDSALDIVLFDRQGKLAGRSPVQRVHAAPPSR
jgi:cobalt-precorrin-5B (C1)-methyltransferase